MIKMKMITTTTTATMNHDDDGAHSPATFGIDFMNTVKVIGFFEHLLFPTSFPPFSTSSH